MVGRCLHLIKGPNKWSIQPNILTKMFCNQSSVTNLHAWRGFGSEHLNLNDEKLQPNPTLTTHLLVGREMSILSSILNWKWSTWNFFFLPSWPWIGLTGSHEMNQVGSTSRGWQTRQVHRVNSNRAHLLIELKCQSTPNTEPWIPRSQSAISHFPPSNKAAFKCYFWQAKSKLFPCPIKKN